VAVRVIEGDCLRVLPTLDAGGIDAVVTDPPYDLTGASRNGSPRANDPTKPFGRHRLQDKGFMGLQWDGSRIAFNPETWRLVLAALKPGGYLLAFGGTRTQHRMACAIEDAGFEIRDCLLWVYGSGFPKGQGCLKPAYEPIILARRPGKRVLPLGIDGCRVPGDEDGSRNRPPSKLASPNVYAQDEWTRNTVVTRNDTTGLGRYPANLLHDGSEEVLEAFAAFGQTRPGHHPRSVNSVPGSGRTMRDNWSGQDLAAAANNGHGDAGTAARFFYTAKAGKKERGEGNTHPTVKPLALMRWLVRLITPPGGAVLDPFGGSGTTGIAAQMEGRNAVLIEREPAYCEIIRKRLAEASPLFAEAV
jgi:site-specific DNA-methyltransferase (adenine-specific)